jgi:flagellar hook-basal body complex protein FliE
MPEQPKPTIGAMRAASMIFDHFDSLSRSEAATLIDRETDAPEMLRTIDEANDAAIAANCCGSEFHDSPANTIRHLAAGRESSRNRLKIAIQARRELLEALEELARMAEMVRGILTGGKPRPECSWGALDTSAARAAIAKAKGEST